MNDLLFGFMNGHTGSRPDDYYYNYNKSGKKYYFSKITEKRVAIKNIPPAFIPQIKMDQTYSMDTKQTRREEYKKEQDELLRKLFEQFASSKNKIIESANNSVLIKLNIKNKHDWKQWLLLNHPDKVVIPNYANK